MLKFPGYFYCLKTLVTGWLKERSLRSLKTIAQSSEIAGARYFSAEALPSNLSEKGDDHLQGHEDLEITIEREQPRSFITLKLANFMLSSIISAINTWWFGNSAPEKKDHLASKKVAFLIFHFLVPMIFAKYASSILSRLLADHIITIYQ